MELGRLEKYKKKFKSFQAKIGSLQSYLSHVNMGRSGMSIISPYAVSKELKIPEMDAYFLLSLAEQEHIVHKVYKVWTVEDDYFLGDYPDQKLIPDVITNDATGKEVDKDGFYVDVVFELENG